MEKTTRHNTNTRLIKRRGSCSLEKCCGRRQNGNCDSTHHSDSSGSACACHSSCRGTGHGDCCWNQTRPSRLRTEYLLNHSHANTRIRLVSFFGRIFFPNTLHQDSSCERCTHRTLGEASSRYRFWLKMECSRFRPPEASSRRLFRLLSNLSIQSFFARKNACRSPNWQTNRRYVATQRGSPAIATR
jgi:hypothetical protein